MSNSKLKRLRRLKERLSEAPPDDVVARFSEFICLKLEDRKARGLETGPIPSMDEIRARTREFVENKKKENRE